MWWSLVSRTSTPYRCQSIFKYRVNSGRVASSSRYLTGVHFGRPVISLTMVLYPWMTGSITCLAPLYHTSDRHVNPGISIEVTK